MATLTACGGSDAGGPAAGGSGGWIALHEDQAGKPGRVRYHAHVEDGTSADVRVTVG